MGGGEVARYIGRHGTKRLAKAALISARPPLMLKRRPPRWPADGKIRRDSPGRAADRSQLYQDSPAPVFGANRPGAKVSQGMIDSFWLQGMQAGHKNTFDCIKAFPKRISQKTSAVDVPTLIITATRPDRAIGAVALNSAKLVKNAT